METQEKTKLQEFHEALVKDNYSVPDYNTFSTTLQDTAKAREFYDALVKDKYELPDYETFVSDLGLKKKEDLYKTLGFGRDLVKEVFGEDYSRKKEPEVSKKPSPSELANFRFDDVTDVASRAFRTPPPAKPNLTTPDLTLKTPEAEGYPQTTVEDVLAKGLLAPPDKKEGEKATFENYLTALPQGFNQRMGEAVRNVGKFVNLPQETAKYYAKKMGGKNVDVIAKYVDQAFKDNPLLSGFDQEKFDALATAIEGSGNPKAIPDDLIGKTLASTGSIMFDIMTIRAAPTSKINALAKYGMERVPMFPTYLAAMGGTMTAREGGGVGKVALSTAEGGASGLTYEGMGIAAGRVGQLVKEFGGGQTLSNTSKALANSVMFGADSKLKGGTFAEGAAMGLVFGGYDIGMESIHRSIAHRAYINYLTTTDNAIKNISKMQIDPVELRKQSDELWNEYEQETHPLIKHRLLAEKTSIDNIISVNAMTQEIIKNPKAFIDNINNDTRLSPKEKKMWTDKINTTVKNADPRIAEAEPIVEDIKKKQETLDYWQQDTATDPMIKQSKIESVTSEIKTQQKALETILSKPLDDYAPKKEKKSEKMQEEVNTDEIKVGDKVIDSTGEEFEVVALTETRGGKPALEVRLRAKSDASNREVAENKIWNLKKDQYPNTNAGFAEFLKDYKYAIDIEIANLKAGEGQRTMTSPLTEFTKKTEKVSEKAPEEVDVEREAVLKELEAAIKRTQENGDTEAEKSLTEKYDAIKGGSEFSMKDVTIPLIRGIGAQFGEMQHREAMKDNYQRQLEKYEKTPSEETKKKILQLEKELEYATSYFDLVKPAGEVKPASKPKAPEVKKPKAVETKSVEEEKVVEEPPIVEETPTEVKQETKQAVTKKLDKQSAIREDKIFKEQKNQLLDDLIAAEDILLGSNKENARKIEADYKGKDDEFVDKNMPSYYQHDLKNLPKDIVAKLSKKGIRVVDGQLEVDIYKDGTVKIGDIRTALRVIDKEFPARLKEKRYTTGPGKPGKNEMRMKAEAYGSLAESESRVKMAEENLAEAKRTDRTKKVGKDTVPIPVNKGLVKAMEEQLAETKAIHEYAKSIGEEGYKRIAKQQMMDADKEFGAFWDEFKDHFGYGDMNREQVFDIIEKQGRPKDLTYDTVQPLVIKDTLEREGKTIDEKRTEIEDRLAKNETELKDKFGRKDGTGMRKPKGNSEEWEMRTLNNAIQKDRSKLIDLQKYGKQIPKTNEKQTQEQPDITANEVKEPIVPAGTEADQGGTVKESKTESEVKEPWQMSREEYIEANMPKKGDKGYLNPKTHKYENGEGIKTDLSVEWNRVKEQAYIDGLTKDKPAWAMTSKEFEQKTGNSAEEHAIEVERAIKRNKPVPKEVLAEYPEMAKKTWRDFISPKSRQDIKESFQQKTLPELQNLLANLKMHRDRSTTGKIDKERLRQEVWDIEKLINAHEEANKYNESIVPETTGKVETRTESKTTGGLDAVALPTTKTEIQVTRGGRTWKDYPIHVYPDGRVDIDHFGRKTLTPDEYEVIKKKEDNATGIIKDEQFTNTKGEKFSNGEDIIYNGQKGKLSIPQDLAPGFVKEGGVVPLTMAEMEKIRKPTSEDKAKEPTKEEQLKAREEEIKTKIAKNLEDLMSSMGGIKKITDEQRPTVIKSLVELMQNLGDLTLLKGEQLWERVKQELKSKGVTVPDDLFKEAQDEYTKGDKDEKYRKTQINALIQDRTLQQQTVAEIVSANKEKYTVLHGEDAIAQANIMINEKGVQGATIDLIERTKHLDEFPIRQVARQILLDFYSRAIIDKNATEADKTLAFKHIDSLQQITAREATKAGQGNSLLQIWKSMQPAGLLEFVKRKVEQGNNRILDKKIGDTTVGKQIDELYNTLTEESKRVIDDILAGKKLSIATAGVRTSNKPIQKKSVPKERIKQEHEYRRTLLDEYRKKAKTTSASIALLSSEQIELGGNLIGSYVREGYFRTQAIIERLTRDFKSVGIDLNQKQVNELLSQKKDEKGSYREYLTQEEAATGVKREIGKHINDIVKKHWSEKDELKRTLAQKLVDEAGLVEEDARRLEKAILDEFDRVIMERSQKHLTKILGTEKIPVEKVKKGLVGKMIDLLNMGALDEQLYRDLFAEKFKLTRLTDEHKMEILRLANNVQESGGKGWLERDATIRLAKYIYELYPTNRTTEITDTWIAMAYSNMLSGPFTSVLNLWSAGSNMLIRPIRDVTNLSKWLKLIKNGAKGEGDIYNPFGEMLYSPMLRGVNMGSDAAKEVYINGDLNNKYMEEIAKKNQFKVTQLERDKYGDSKRFKPISVKIGNKIFDLNPFNAYKYAGRNLAAQDKMMLTTSYEVELAHILRDKLKNKNLRGNALTKEVMAIMRGDRINMEALNATLASDMALYKSLTGESMTPLQQRIRKRELMLEQLPVTKEEKDDAERLARSNIFTDDRGGFFATTAQGIGHLANSSSVGGLIIKPFVPFTKVVGNVAEYMMDHTPFYGFMRANGLGVVSMVKRRIDADLPTAQMGEKGSRLYYEQMGRAWLGTVAFSTALAMLLGKDEDDFVEISGGYVKEGFKKRGRENVLPPYTLRIGDVKIPYKNVPSLAIPFALVGNLNDGLKAGVKEGDLRDRLTAALLLDATANSVLMIKDMSFLDGVQRGTQIIADAASGSEKKWGNIGEGVAKGYLGFLTRPLPQNNNAVQQIWKLFDPTAYSQSDIKGMLEYAGGIQHITGRPVLDQLGDVVKTYPGETLLPYTHWLNIKGDDERWKFLAKHNAIPNKLYNRVMQIETKDGLHKRQMEPDELYEYTQRTGKFFSESLIKYMENTEKAAARGKEIIEREKVNGELEKISGVREDVEKLWETSKDNAEIELFRWGSVKEEMPEVWDLIKKHQAYQLYQKTKEIGEDKWNKSELYEFNNIATLIYAKKVRGYLSSQTAELDKKKFNRDGISDFDATINRNWASAKTKAASTMNTKVKARIRAEQKKQQP